MQVLYKLLRQAQSTIGQHGKKIPDQFLDRVFQINPGNDTSALNGFTTAWKGPDVLVFVVRHYLTAFSPLFIQDIPTGLNEDCILCGSFGRQRSILFRVGCIEGCCPGM